MKRTRNSSGFTIVELLIVIVIIGILATIVIVAYNGITTKARQATLQSDVSNNVSALEIYNATNGSYPDASGTDAPTLNDNQGLAQSGTNTAKYYTNGNKDAYCVSSTGPDGTYAATNTAQSPVLGSCSGVTLVAAGTPTTMQSLTKSYCTNTMITYTGSNPSALITLTDNRDGTTRSYTVGKLADGNCWMLDNLKLGSTTGTVTLTPSNSNVSANYTLPQVDTSASGSTGNTSEYSTARVYQTPGDTGSGATNYGYLYSFTAATAGATTTSLPMGTGDAPDSICPAGWRLPTGRATTGDFAKLDIAMGGTGAYQSSVPQAAKWNYAGPFRGVLAGDWYGGFNDQGSNGYLWSSSAYSSNVNGAWDTNFDSGVVYPGGSSDVRSNGFGVRCLLS